MRENRLGGLTSRAVGEKSQKVTRGSHRNDVSPLTQGLRYRAACDTSTLCRSATIQQVKVMVKVKEIPDRQSVGFYNHALYKSIYLLTYLFYVLYFYVRYVTLRYLLLQSVLCPMRYLVQRDAHCFAFVRYWCVRLVNFFMFILLTQNSA